MPHVQPALGGPAQIAPQAQAQNRALGGGGFGLGMTAPGMGLGPNIDSSALLHNQNLNQRLANFQQSNQQVQQHLQQQQQQMGMQAGGIHGLGGLALGGAPQVATPSANMLGNAGLGIQANPGFNIPAPAQSQEVNPRPWLNPEVVQKLMRQPGMTPDILRRLISRPDLTQDMLVNVLRHLKMQHENQMAGQLGGQLGGGEQRIKRPRSSDSGLDYNEGPDSISDIFGALCATLVEHQGGVVQPEFRGTVDSILAVLRVSEKTGQITEDAEQLKSLIQDFKISVTIAVRRLPLRNLQLIPLSLLKEWRPSHPILLMILGILTEGDKQIQVAIKALRVQGHIEETEVEKRLRKRFYREVLLWRRLQHSNVVPLLGYITLPDGLPALISPWYVNGNVIRYLQASPTANRLSLALDVVRGLEYLHSIEVTHGDLKGENVLVDADGRAGLCDFGMSQFISEASRISGFTTTGNGGGTDRFMCPELLEDHPKTPATDVWALGCLLVQILTDEIPYQKIIGKQALLMAILRGAPPMSNEAGGIAEALWNCIKKCWNVVPDNRPRTSELEQQLVLQCARPQEVKDQQRPQQQETQEKQKNQDQIRQQLLQQLEQLQPQQLQLLLQLVQQQIAQMPHAQNLQQQQQLPAQGVIPTALQARASNHAPNAFAQQQRQQQNSGLTRRGRALGLGELAPIASPPATPPNPDMLGKAGLGFQATLGVNMAEPASSPSQESWLTPTVVQTLSKQPGMTPDILRRLMSRPDLTKDKVMNVLRQLKAQHDSLKALKPIPTRGGSPGGQLGNSGLLQKLMKQPGMSIDSVRKLLSQPDLTQKILQRLEMAQHDSHRVLNQSQSRDVQQEGEHGGGGGGM
ncbi:hypothetical protein FRC02_003396 [Tulasnella sp. 418]|nr:hypothetical protein FRC02_003396 [Tulasnella sp. 418]